MGARPRLVAHRGGAGLWPENSLEAFRRSIALGVDDLEVDVQPTADGALAVIHDQTLERTTTGHGRVVECVVSDLARLRLRSPDGSLTSEHVPTLEEVLALTAPAPVGLFLEIKDPRSAPRWERRNGVVRQLAPPRYEGIEERVLAALARAGLESRTVIIAFNPTVIARVRTLAPAQRTTLLIGRRDAARVSARPADVVGCAQQVGAASVGLDHVLVDVAVVRAARAAGLGVAAWTVDDQAEMQRLAALGIDAITTDRPDIARRVFFGERA